MSWISDWTEGKQKYAKHITRYPLSSFWGVPARKTLCLYPETVLKNCQSLEEISLRGGKLVKNFKMFWMNNKTIIEFRFSVMWRIGHFRVPKPSLSKWCQVDNLSCENEFYLHENEKSFHFKGWELNLVLIQRPGRSRKWPIVL